MCNSINVKMQKRVCISNLCEGTRSHKLQLVVLDPAASTHKNFRLQLDYLLFEPIN